MKLQESGENYLENILILERKNGQVRSVDLAREMDFSKPSVSRAIHLLEDNGYLKISNTGLLELTNSGREVAEMIYERHLFLSNYLMALGVDPETAADDACRMEHVISAESFSKMKQHIKNCAENCPHANDDQLFCFNTRYLQAFHAQDDDSDHEASPCGTCTACHEA